MNLGQNFPLGQVDADVNHLLAALRQDQALAGARPLTAAECAYVAALDIAVFTTSESLEPKQAWLGRLLLHGLGALIMLVVLLLVPIYRPLPGPTNVLSLSLQGIEVRPNDPREQSPVENMPAEPLPVAIKPDTLATSDTGSAKPVSDSPMRTTPSISQSKVAVLQAWSDNRSGQEMSISGQYQGQGTVFDSGLKERLSHIAPGRVALGAAASTLADVNGTQEVVLGDRCFHVAKLDDQAMRGMGVWTRGHCTAPGANKEKIKLGVLP